MAVQVFVAKMTDFMEEGVILSWLIKEGEAVEEGQPILELEIDKAVAELESPASSFLKGIRSGAVASVRSRSARRSPTSSIRWTRRWTSCRRYEAAFVGSHSGVERLTRRRPSRRIG